MRGSLSGADDAAGGLAVVVPFRPSMNNKQQHRSDESNGLPAITIWVRVWLRCVKRVVEHVRSSFERQAVLDAVHGRLVRVPRPAHDRTVL